jgi:hypothetical protein
MSGSVAVDIKGRRFGKLLAVDFHSKNKRGMHLWLFSCDCGKTKPIVKSTVVSGNTRSCGCANPLRSYHANSRLHSVHNA